MHSTPNPKPSDDPHDILVVAPDVARVAPAEDQISELLHEAAARHRSESKPRVGADFSADPMARPVDTTFRPAATNVRDTRDSTFARAVRGCVALLLAACIGVAAFAWRSYADTAKRQVAKLTTQLAMISWPEAEKPGLAAQPAASDVQADTANAAAPQPEPPAQSASEVAPPAAPPSDSAQLLRSMTRDLASLGQEVEQLKASIEQLRVSQQQMSRDVAKASEVRAPDVKASEQNQRLRMSALPRRPAAPATRKPFPSYPASQASTAATLPATAPYMTRQLESQPQAPAQLTDPELASVPRPPMPVR